jgi:hypothetical protein
MAAIEAIAAAADEHEREETEQRRAELDRARGGPGNRKMRPL